MKKSKYKETGIQDSIIDDFVVIITLYISSVKTNDRNSELKIHTQRL